MTPKAGRGKSIRIFIALIILNGLAAWFVVVAAMHGRTVRYGVAQVSPGPVRPTPSVTSGSALNVGLPLRLLIPKLKVDAKIEYMGETTTGAMDVPADVTDAGWYMYGAHPGDEGSAVIGGHLNGVNGAPGVFLNLNRLIVGDSFMVLDDTGKTTNFKVHKIQSYGQNEQPSEVFHSTKGVHLNLITCTGAWNRADNRFSKRLVVFADKSS